MSGLADYLKYPIWKCEFTPHEIVIGRPTSIGIQPSADPLLSHPSMTSYCKSCVSDAQAYHQQIREAFLDPVGHSLESSEWLF